MTEGHRSSVFVHTVTAALVLLIGRGVHGGEVDEVTLTVTACPTVFKRELSRILDIELRTLAAGKKEVNPAPTVVSVVCEDDRVLLQAHITQEDKYFSRSVSTPSAHVTDGDARLIAITACELVFSAWVAVSPPNRRPHIEKTARSPKQATKTEEPPSKETNASGTAPRLPHVFRFEVGPTWRTYFDGGAHLFGGAVAASIRLVAPLYLRTTLSVETGGRERPLGRVSLFSVSDAVAVGVAKSYGARLTIGAEIGGRFGYGFIRGHRKNNAVQQAKVRGGFGGPMLGVGVRTMTNPYAVLFAEIGYAPYGNIGHVEEGAAVTTTGLWLFAVPAIGFDF